MLADSSSDSALLLGLQNLSKTGESIGIEYPIQVELFDGNDASLQTLTLSQSDLNSFHPIFALQTSGNYTIAITDNAGSQLQKNITITPDAPESLELNLGSTVVQSKQSLITDDRFDGAVSTSVVTILDQYDNPVSGTTFTLDMDISGGGLIFEDTQDADASVSVFE